MSGVRTPLVRSVSVRARERQRRGRDDQAVLERLRVDRISPSPHLFRCLGSGVEIRPLVWSTGQPLGPRALAALGRLTERGHVVEIRDRDEVLGYERSTR